ncbi:ABC transporter permease [Thermococcus aciditolerans]|uniref:ABC transporter permease n=1 Tax=Thermococcus aciditolerans TaxID=2598455 RepID=A0A5C0SKN4_9EURY|nr:ABC transporter permease subunit [Thermococcus aciditolerans]QEK15065.1 ABC transporter permease [Thermococcus aciditolerans]
MRTSGLKLGVAIIVIYTIAAFMAPYFVNEEKIENWYNGLYWKDNPRLAPPSWVNLLGKSLPPTEELAPVKSQPGLQVFEYDFRYSTPPQNIIVKFNRTEGRQVTVTVTTPSGENYLFHPGTSVDEISLAYQWQVLMEIANDRGVEFRMEDTAFRRGLRPLFFVNRSGEVVPEHGVYTITVEGAINSTVKIVGATYGILGTDTYGRDVGAAFLWGARQTVILVYLTAVVAVALGTLTGLAASLRGRAGTAVDSISKLSTIIPVIPFMIALIPLTGSVSYNARITIPVWAFVPALAFLLFGKIARNVGAIVRTELNKEYVAAAESLGADRRWVLRRHILRIVGPYSIYQLSLFAPKVIALVSILGFFRVAPGFNWGTMLGMVLSQNAIYSMAWWMILPIGLALVLFALAFVLINRELEERFLSRG